MKTISMGEIYFRMVQCLYKKFTITKRDSSLRKISLVAVLMSIGKLALETLLSGNSLLERRQIVDQVGEEVFEYGLLIGADGFSLTLDMTVDILVTFPHRSLQEFLGAFYFVLSLGKKQAVNDVDRSVWRIFEKSVILGILSLACRRITYVLFISRTFCMLTRLLNIYVAEQIDAVEVDFQKLEINYPVFSLALGR